jgi:HlyD family secretion protein
MNKKRIILIAVAAVIIVGGGVWLFGGAKAKHKVTYATATIHKGEISESVTATGTIEPVTEVEVGTQVSGIIDKIHVDYNSVVTKGQLIAEMDRVTLQSELASQRAAYNGAKAEYEYQKKLYERNKTLNEKQLIAATDYEQSVYNYEKAKSNYESSQASLAKAERNLSYATITSPIDGVVISRDVEAGQTVASGFETPTLFTIAADLTQMQVVADVDEADIGGVEEGQRATFTVDAYPNDVFEGVVTQIRLGDASSSSTSSTSTSTVVTYEVVCSLAGWLVRSPVGTCRCLPALPVVPGRFWLCFLLREAGGRVRIRLGSLPGSIRSLSRLRRRRVSVRRFVRYFLRCCSRSVLR